MASVLLCSDDWLSSITFVFSLKEVKKALTSTPACDFPASHRKSQRHNSTSFCPVVDVSEFAGNNQLLNSFFILSLTHPHTSHVQTLSGKN